MQLKAVPRWLVGVLFVLVAWLIYHRLPSIYFSQDEWFGFGKAIYARSQPFSYYFATLSGHHANPLNLYFVFRLFGWFGFQSRWYQLVDLTLHLLVTWLVFRLGERLAKDRIVGVLAGVFFLAISTPSQAVTWIGAGVGTLGAALFGLLSLWWFLDVLEGKPGRWAGAFGLAILSFLFKETTAFLPIFYLWLVWQSCRQKTGRFWRQAWPLFGMIVLIAGLRLLPILIKPGGSDFVQGDAKQSVATLLFHLVSYPFEVLTQVLVPERVLLSWVGWLGGRTVVTGTWLEIGFSLVVFLVLLLAARRRSADRQFVWLASLFILTSMLPYAVLNKPGLVFESRHLYLAAVGAAWLFGLLVGRLVWRWRMIGLIAVVLGGWYLVWQGWITTDTLEAEYTVGEVRRGILDEITRRYPTLPERVLIYTESDRGYFGLSEPIMPFQTGFAYPLMAIYGRDGCLPTDFFAGEFLWEMRQQAYEEHQGRGFGYARDIGRLTELMQQNQLPPESIIAFRWKDSQLTDITSLVRRRLAYASQSMMLAQVAKQAGFQPAERPVVFAVTGQNEIGQEVPSTTVLGAQPKLEVAPIGRFAGFVGANLDWPLAGAGTALVRLPNSVLGGQIVHIQSARIANEPVPIRRVQQQTDGGWQIELGRVARPDEPVIIQLWLSVFQLDMRDKGTRDAAAYEAADVQQAGQTEELSTRMAAGTQEIRLTATGEVRGIPLAADRRPTGYLDGLQVQLESAQIAGREVTIRLKVPVLQSAEFRLPVLVTVDRHGL